MKAFASSVLYVFSIVLAVGIGMFQVGKEVQNDLFASNLDCKIEKQKNLCVSGLDCGFYNYSSTKASGNASYRNAMEMSTADHMKQCYSFTNSKCNIVLRDAIIWDQSECGE